MSFIIRANDYMLVDGDATLFIIHIHIFIGAIHKIFIKSDGMHV